jgi:hypothetical protein
VKNPSAWRRTNREAMAQPKALWNGHQPPETPLPPRAPVLATSQPTPPARPVLEVNRIPQRDLKRLIELIGQRGVERALNVHRTTVLRWVSGRISIPGAQVLAVRALLGDLPGTAGKWTGWRFHDGMLYAPGGDRYTPGEVLALRLQQQRVREFDRENRELKARIRVLEATLDLVSPAANQEQAHA